MCDASEESGQISLYVYFSSHVPEFEFVFSKHLPQRWIYVAGGDLRSREDIVKRNDGVVASSSMYTQELQFHGPEKTCVDARDAILDTFRSLSEHHLVDYYYVSTMTPLKFFEMLEDS
jgi:hypothetical protein